MEKNNNRNILIAGAAVIGVLLIGIAILLVQNVKQSSNLNDLYQIVGIDSSDEIADVAERMEFEKSALENEYNDLLAMQYDGYQLTITNDSLIHQLENEKHRVQDLLEELRITKATDARKIAELKKELATIREVMKQYVAQIDSLDRTNKKLVKENQEYRQQYQEAAQQNQTLTEEKTRLTEVVSRASMMEITNFSVTTLKSGDRKTTRFNSIEKLQFDFTILKNITTRPGNKVLYTQLRRPDGDVMVKSESHVFSFENGTIPYSVKKEFEYAGEELSLVLYWPVEEILQKGLYTMDFFIDGNLVGSFPFKLD